MGMVVPTAQKYCSPVTSEHETYTLQGSNSVTDEYLLKMI